MDLKKWVKSIQIYNGASTVVCFNQSDVFFHQAKIWWEISSKNMKTSRPKLCSCTPVILGIWVKGKWMRDADSDIETGNGEGRAYGWEPLGPNMQVL